MDNHESSIERMRGVLSAIFTPLDSANRINFQRLEEIANFQLRGGLSGFFVAGSTGESLLLDFEERVAITDYLAKTFGGQALIVAHVGHPSTDVAVRLAQQAAKSGAHWISAVAPIYYGTTFAGAIRHYRAIAQATDLPFMVYSLGSEVIPDRDKALFELPNVCGMKYTGANFFSVQQLQRLVDRPLALMSGFDEQFVAGQSFGFQGGIGSTYNFAPRFYSGIFNAYLQGDIAEASRLQARINQVTHFMVQYENWSYRKAIMRYIGLDCGAYRAPYIALEEHEYETFAEQLDQLGVLQRNEALDS